MVTKYHNMKKKYYDDLLKKREKHFQYNFKMTLRMIRKNRKKKLGKNDKKSV
jgi:hypothetical protein